MARLKGKIAPLPTSGRINNPRDKGDMYNRPFIHNADGTTSTMLSSIFNDDDGFHIISAVWDGETHSPQEAIQRYYDVGDNGMATYDSLENAEIADKAMHEREERRLQYEDDPQALKEYVDSLERADGVQREPKKSPGEILFGTSIQEGRAAMG